MFVRIRDLCGRGDDRRPGDHFRSLVGEDSREGVIAELTETPDQLFFRGPTRPLAPCAGCQRKMPAWSPSMIESIGPVPTVRGPAMGR